MAPTSLRRKVAYGTAASAASFLGGAELIEFRLLGHPIPLILDDVNVSIHVPTINEEGWVGRCMESLTSQELYKQYKHENVKIVLVDSDSTDRSVQIAQPYVDKVMTVPRGKLYARHEAILRDVEADIIVSTDADCIHPSAWLSNLLAPFADPGVVGTHGPCLSTDRLWKPFRAWGSLFQNHSGRFYARSSAFRRWAYLEAGGFDLSVNQYDRSGELVKEEEHDFKTRLEQVGKVVYVHAGVYTSERHMALTTEKGDVEKYRAEQKAGIRF